MPANPAPTMTTSSSSVSALSVGFVSIADYGILPPALKRFREQFPKVDVQLHELTTEIGRAHV